MNTPHGENDPARLSDEFVRSLQSFAQRSQAQAALHSSMAEALQDYADKMTAVVAGLQDITKSGDEIKALREHSLVVMNQCMERLAPLTTAYQSVNNI